jgi:hypothetical protein
MAMDNAEKQRRWREAHLGADRVRLSLVVSVEVAARLKRLARHRDVSVTELIEDAARRGEGAAVARMTAAEEKRYFKKEI